MRFHVTLILISFLSPHQVQNSVYDHADGALHNHAMIPQYSYITTSFWCLLNRKKQLFCSSSFILFILSSKLFYLVHYFVHFDPYAPERSSLNSVVYLKLWTILVHIDIIDSGCDWMDHPPSLDFRLTILSPTHFDCVVCLKALLWVLFCFLFST